MIRFLRRLGLGWGIMLAGVSGLAATELEVLTDWRALPAAELRAKYHLTSCTECALLRGDTDNVHRQDPAVAKAQLSQLAWFRPQRWVPATIQFFRAAAIYPALAVSEVNSWTNRIFFSLWVAVLIVGCLYFWPWAKPFAKDWPRLLRSDRVVRLLIWVFLITVVSFGAYAIGALGMATLLVIYSRHFKSAVSIWALVLVSHCASPLLQVAIRAAENSSIIEALWNGRSRVLYSPDASQALNPIEKLAWQRMNAGTERMILPDSIATSRDGRLLFAISKIDFGGPMKMFSEVEPILKGCEDDPVCRFNLVQLYTDTQNLFAADQTRAKMDPRTWESLSLRALKEDTRYLWLPSRSTAQVFLESWLASFADVLTPTLLVWLLAPLGFLGMALWLRVRASGLCQFTGEPTATVKTIESSLYQSARGRGPKNTGSQRLNTEAMIRDFRHQSESRARLWSWLIPRVDALCLEFSFLSPLLLFWITVLLWTGSAPSRWIERMFEQAHLAQVPELAASSWNLSMAILAGLVHGAFFVQNLRRAPR